MSDVKPSTEEDDVFGDLTSFNDDTNNHDVINDVTVNEKSHRSLRPRKSCESFLQSDIAKKVGLEAIISDCSYFQIVVE